jgi:hypothetical protein
MAVSGTGPAIAFEFEGKMVGRQSVFLVRHNSKHTIRSGMTLQTCTLSRHREAQSSEMVGRDLPRSLVNNYPTPQNSSDLWHEGIMML